MPVGSFDFMVSENLFYIRQSLVSESSVFALYPTNSRFNHSCAPNTNASDNVDDTKEMFATNDIDSGEESHPLLTIYMTRSERNESLQSRRFTCECRVCHLEAPLQELSDLRRRLIRG
ncbi:hypothetical protein N7508_005631 [Penicillium antarcticum]|uniref:uncharacterized protein n=1 Tax=Penicillium antarcticum TaxID=416450 RepID=UPI00238272A0|nr:uncharacterized protein N7508_005631 [Penicillium antarcticum]KAJ5306616.1 hypothetical protein N7508_005631 [Penicillium antarcticum]